MKSPRPGSSATMAHDVDYRTTIQTAMLELTTDFATNTEVDRTLARVTALAVDLIDGADYADVMLIEGATFRSVAPSASVVSDLDRVQRQFNEGPCLDAATSTSTIRSDDLATEPRWPRFAAVALDAGINSALSFQLFTHRHGGGALNLLSKQRNSFSVDGETIGAMLATHAAIALMEADRRKQFESALASRDLIGQAKGMIMKEFSVDAVAAFELMVKLSQDTNTVLRTVAQQVIDTLG
jgi:transcriptional regulator with GAF, ATPase, and Fis domain